VSVRVSHGAVKGGLTLRRRASLNQENGARSAAIG
jgi:hypothetical protein